MKTEHLFMVIILTLGNRHSLVASLNQLIPFIRDTSLDGNNCIKGSIISETRYTSYVQCLVSCSKQTFCIGVFVRPEIKQCIACSAAFFTANVSTVSIYYKRYDHNAEIFTYVLVTEQLNWYQAKQYCEDLGGNLLILSSQEENDFIIEHLAALEKVGVIHIGGKGTGGQAATFKWVDGSAFSDGYTNWQPGQPYPKLNEERYVAMLKDWNFKWNDDRDSEHSSICEFN